MEEYATWLGMDLTKDKDHLWIAREGLKSPLPENWKPCKTVDTVRFEVDAKKLTCSSTISSSSCVTTGHGRFPFLWGFLAARPTCSQSYIYILVSLFSYFRKRSITSTLKQEKVLGITLVMLIIERFLKIINAHGNCNDTFLPSFGLGPIITRQ